jgi:hypothetical protein
MRNLAHGAAVSADVLGAVLAVEKHRAHVLCGSVRAWRVPPVRWFHFVPAKDHAMRRLTSPNAGCRLAPDAALTNGPSVA